VSPMHAVLLAAGAGSRLRPYTDDRPKCLVELCGRPLLEHQRAALAAAGVERLTVVAGYRAEQLRARGLEVRESPDWESTNMVHSLMRVRDLLAAGEDLLVVYGDLVFEPRWVEALAASDAPVSVAVDLDWEELWRLRMEDPLADAETLRMRPDGSLAEIGGTPTSLEEIEAQYLGLVRIGRGFGPALLELHDGLPPEGVRGRAPTGMYMTDLLQALVDAGHRVAAVPGRGGWLEVDTVRDLETYRRLAARGDLAPRWQAPAAGEP